MALLSDVDRKALWADLMDRLSRDGERLPIDKPALRAAVNAADQWLSDNAASFNAALPAAARTTFSAAQKARLLAFVITKRFEKGA